jgi:hypothetical protein
MEPGFFISGQERNISIFSKHALFMTQRILFKQTICISCAILLFAALVWAQESPDGHWEAGVTAMTSGPRIMIDIMKNAKLQWVASVGMSFPNQNMIDPMGWTGLDAQSFMVNGASVSFVAPEPLNAKFDLTLGADRTMKGTITGPGAPPMNLDFKRTGEAKVSNNPFVGTWQMNVEKSKHSGPAPKSSTVRFMDAGNGTVFAQETVDSQGKIQRLTASEPWDGKEGASVFPGETAICSRMDSNTVVLVFKKDGKETRRITEAISNDGKTLTRTVREAQENEPGIIAVYEKQ